MAGRTRCIVGGRSSLSFRAYRTKRAVRERTGGDVRRARQPHSRLVKPGSGPLGTSGVVCLEGASGAAVAGDTPPGGRRGFLADSFGGSGAGLPAAARGRGD